METVKLNTPLTIEQIDFRVQSINKGGYATILAYKDARADMNRLDEVYGIEGWQKKYDVIDGNLYCSVGVYSAKSKEWIWKQDVGTESMAEKEKGQASDAFKRACFNFGIGRELYAYPVMQIKLEANEWKSENGKVQATWDLKIKDWKWFSEFKDGVIIKLSCKDQTGKVRWAWDIEKGAINATPISGTPAPVQQAPKSTAMNLEQSKNLLNTAKDLSNLKALFLSLPVAVQKEVESYKNELKEKLTPKQKAA